MTKIPFFVSRCTILNGSHAHFVAIHIHSFSVKMQTLCHCLAFASHFVSIRSLHFAQQHNRYILRFSQRACVCVHVFFFPFARWFADNLECFSQIQNSHFIVFVFASYCDEYEHLLNHKYFYTVAEIRPRFVFRPIVVQSHVTFTIAIVIVIVLCTHRLRLLNIFASNIKVMPCHAMLWRVTFAYPTAKHASNRFGRHLHT